MITTISNSDLRVFTTGKKFRLFGVTALQLVQKSRMLEANARPAIVCVRITTSLTEIVKRLAATGLHRVYVLDEEEKPIGVISLRDLIRFILPRISDQPVNWS
jgi:CBS domain-containing protein